MRAVSGSVVLLLAAAACGGDDPPVTVDGPPVVEIDAPFPTDGRIPGTEADLTLRPQGLGAGVLTFGIDGGAALGECGSQPCTFTVQVGQKYRIRQVPLGVSTFAGWLGCDPGTSDDCIVTVQDDDDININATFNVVDPVTWNRTARQPAVPLGLALAPDGVVVAGSVPVESGPGSAIWIAHYRPGGTPSVEIIDHPAGSDGARSVAAHPPGGFVVVADFGAAPAQVRRYTTAGSLDWMVPLDGAAGGRGTIAVDPAGNIYVVFASGTTHSILSLNPTGGERWRDDTGHQVYDLALRDGVLVAAGGEDPLGWIGTYALDGTPGWDRTVARAGVAPEMTLTSVAIDSDGDIAYGGLAAGPAPFTHVHGVVDATGATIQWSAELPGNGEVAVGPDHSVAVWTAAPSLVRYTEAGVAGAPETMALIPSPGGFALDASGAAFLAGTSVGLDPSWPVIERRP